MLPRREIVFYAVNLIRDKYSLPIEIYKDDIEVNFFFTQIGRKRLLYHKNNVLFNVKKAYIFPSFRLLLFQKGRLELKLLHIDVDVKKPKFPISLFGKANILLIIDKNNAISWMKLSLNDIKIKKINYMGFSIRDLNLPKLLLELEKKKENEYNIISSDIDGKNIYGKIFGKIFFDKKEKNMLLDIKIKINIRDKRKLSKKLGIPLVFIKDRYTISIYGNVREPRFRIEPSKR